MPPLGLGGVVLRPWADIAAGYDELVLRSGAFDPLLDVVESVVGSACAGLLSGGTAGHELVVVPAGSMVPHPQVTVVRAPSSRA